MIDAAIIENSTLLLVDDVPNNLKVLYTYLTGLGFKVRVARDGIDALAQVKLQPPDLILLDVMMPKIDGFETCRRLKEDPETADIPVIFMTALTDTIDKLEGFEVGAIDYITKPIQQEEVLARISTHLAMRHLQMTLEQQNLELQEQNQELEAFARTVAHDLKNPINSIIGYLSVAKIEFDAENITDAIGYVANAENAAWRMNHIVNALLTLARSRKDKVEMHPVAMEAVILQVQQRIAPLIEESSAIINFPQAAWPQSYAYAPWIEEVWVNYISNAIKYGGKPPVLDLGFDDENAQISFWVRDNGEGLSPTEQKSLFIPFSRLHRDRQIEGHGLGLSIVQRIVERCNGKVGVISQKGQGSVFYFTLPRITDLHS
jgi:two-component system, sensor histidine kinase and response regulator